MKPHTAPDPAPQPVPVASWQMGKHAWHADFETGRHAWPEGLLRSGIVVVGAPRHAPTSWKGLIGGPVQSAGACRPSSSWWKQAAAVALAGSGGARLESSGSAAHGLV